MHLVHTVMLYTTIFSTWKDGTTASTLAWVVVDIVVVPGVEPEAVDGGVEVEGPLPGYHVHEPGGDDGLAQRDGREEHA